MEQFYEQIVIRRNKAGATALYWLLAILMVISAAVALTSLMELTAMRFSVYNFVMLGVCGGLAYGIYKLKDRLRIEYEYTFTAGELDFAQVTNNARRKHLLNVRLKEALLLASQSSPAYGQYSGFKKESVHNYALNSGPSVYFLVIRRGNDERVILFEPDQEMLETIRTYAPGLYQEQ